MGVAGFCMGYSFSWFGKAIAIISKQSEWQGSIAGACAAIGIFIAFYISIDRKEVK